MYMYISFKVTAVNGCTRKYSRWPIHGRKRSDLKSSRLPIFQTTFHRIPRNFQTICHGSPQNFKQVFTGVNRSPSHSIDITREIHEIGRSNHFKPDHPRERIHIYVYMNISVYIYVRAYIVPNNCRQRLH